MDVGIAEKYEYVPWDWDVSSPAGPVFDYLCNFCPSYTTSKHDLRGLGFEYDWVIATYPKLSTNAEVYVFQGSGLKSAEHPRDTIYKIHFMLNISGKLVPALMVRFTEGKLDIIMDNFTPGILRARNYRGEQASHPPVMPHRLEGRSVFMLSEAFDILARREDPTPPQRPLEPLKSEQNILSGTANHRGALADRRLIPA